MADSNAATDTDTYDLPDAVTGPDPYRVKPYVVQPDAKPAVPYNPSASANAGLLAISPAPANNNAATLGVTPPVQTASLSSPPARMPVPQPQSSGGEIPTAGVGQQGAKPAWEQAKFQIMGPESGGKNVYNYKHDQDPSYYTASGKFQMVDSTYREGAALAGIDISHWPEAINAPDDVQDRIAHAIYDKYGFAPWDKQHGGPLNPDGSKAGSNASTLGVSFENLRQQYLQRNPAGYDPASLNPRLEELTRQQMAAEQPLIDARMRRQQEEEKEADEQYKHLQKDLDDPALKPWTQKPPAPDPIGGLASLGSVFAAFASAFSHTPAIAAMNGMAAAIDARNAGNEKQYDDAFKAYKYNADIALKRNEIQQKAYDAAWARVKENPELGLAELRSVATVFNDEKSLLQLESGNLEEADKINRSRQENADKWAIEIEKLNPDLRFGGIKGSGDDAFMRARIQQHMADGDDNNTATTKAWHELNDAKAQTRLGGTVAGSQLNDIKNDFRKANPKASEGELDRMANAALAESKKIGSSNPKTMTFLAFKAKHIAEGDSEGEATMKAYTDIAVGGGKPVDDDTLDLSARLFLETGHMPPLGIGGSAIRTQILTKAAGIAKEKGYSAEDVVAIQSGVKADQATLTTLTKSLGGTRNFEGTAEREMNLAKEYMEKGAGRSGIPVVNRWIQAGRAGIEGDPDVTQFNTALTSFKNEYAKIMSSPGGNNQQTTDAARAEAEQIINGSQTKQQLLANMDAMRRGMANRIDSIEAEINETQSRLRHPSPGGTGGATASGPAAPASGTVIRYDKAGNRIVDPPT